MKHNLNTQPKIYSYMSAETEKIQHKSCGKRRDESTRRRKFQTVCDGFDRKIFSPKLRSYRWRKSKLSTWMEPTRRHTHILCINYFESEYICVDQKVIRWSSLRRWGEPTWQPWYEMQPRYLACARPDYGKRPNGPFLQGLTEHLFEVRAGQQQHGLDQETKRGNFASSGTGGGVGM